VPYQQLLIFRRDWKKLTFYYFADEYINFNSLVTDLFKVYKTRIWMSAINPASFQTPLGGLQIPGAVGPSGPSTFNSDMNQYAGRRQQRQHPTSTSAGSTQAALSTFDQTWRPSRNSNAINTMAFPQMYGQPFHGSDLNVHHLDQYPTMYRQNIQQPLNMQSPFTSGSYDSPNLHHSSSSFTSRPGSSNGGTQSLQVLGRDWDQSFQGLSFSD
jgi:hypothetical protein